MVTRKTIAFVLLISAVAAVVAVAAPPFVYRHRTRPGIRCCIPDHDYQARFRSRSVTAVSMRGVLLEKDTETTEEDIQAALSPAEELENGGANANGDNEDEQPKEPQVKIYQLDRSKLQIDHCSISQVALQLEDEGKWFLSLRADQNRRPDPDRRPRYNPLLYIKQNEFVVTLRCLGAADTVPFDLDRGAGRPVLLQLGPIEFYVRNGAPYYLRTSKEGKQEDGDAQTELDNQLIKQFFEEIDRVEVEFFYR